MANYFDALPKSFGASAFTTETIPGINYKVANNFSLSNIDFNKVPDLAFNPFAFTPDLDLTATGWTFITAPEDISWDIANQSNRIDMFGTNNPPVVAGTKGMRDLSLGNSLVEGFVRNVTVEGKLAALEKLTNYKETLSDGFVSVPVYQVWASEKSYGNGYYIIKDVKIKESMRDLRGDATRAYVDISFTEVPEYQVNSGRDLASKPAAAAKSTILPDQRAATDAQKTTAQKAATDQADGKKQSNVGKPENRSGASTPQQPSAKAPQKTPTPKSPLTPNPILPPPPRP